MAKTYHYTSINEIIAKVYADLQLPEGNYDIPSCITWAGEAIKKIGAFNILKNRITGIADEIGVPQILTITGYRARLPKDLHALSGVAVSKSKTGVYSYARYGTGDFQTRFGAVQPASTSSLAGETYPPSMYDKIEFISDIFNESYSDAFARISGTSELATILDSVFAQSNEGGNLSAINDDIEDEDYVYTISAPFINFNLESGYAMLAYKAIAVDDNGYPMIPDDEDIKEAVYWYINMKLTYPMYRRGEVHGDVYFHAETEWKKKKLAAYGNSVMPSAGEMQSLINTWNRLIPNINHSESFYNNISKQQQIYRR